MQDGDASSDLSLSGDEEEDALLAAGPRAGTATAWRFQEQLEQVLQATWADAQYSDVPELELAVVV